MGFLDSILGGQNQSGNERGGANPILGVLTGLLAQSGGIQGLLNKFTQAGHDDKVKSWIGTGENERNAAIGTIVRLNFPLEIAPPAATLPRLGPQDSICLRAGPPPSARRSGTGGFPLRNSAMARL